MLPFVRTCSVNTGMGRVRASAALVLILAAQASGQTLNLDAPSAPPGGNGKETLELALLFDKQIASAQKTDPDPTDRTLALRTAVRELTRNLLRSGELSGEQGSAQVVAGRTLALRLEGLDLHIQTVGRGLSDEVIAAMADRCRVAPEKLPFDASSLWRFLRDALAPLVTRAQSPAHVVDAGDAQSATLESVARSRNASNGLISACAALDTVIAGGAPWPAYSSSVSVLRQHAMDAMRLATAPPASGVPVVSRGALEEAFIRAASGVTSPAQDGVPREDDARAVGARQLWSMSLAWRCLERTLHLAPEASAKTMRDAVTALFSRKDLKTNLAAVFTEDAAVAARLARIQPLLARLAAPTEGCAVDADEVVRQVRPAIKPLEESRLQGAGELLEACARAVSSPDVLSDPGFLEAINSYEARRKDAAIPAVVTSRLGHRPATPTGQEGTKWVLQEAYEFAGDRLLLLSRGVASARDHDDALAALRDMGSGLEAYADDAGAAVLRKGIAEGGALGDELRHVTGGRGEDLLARLEEARSKWKDEVHKARQIRADGLAAATRSLEEIQDAIALAARWSMVRAELVEAGSAGGRFGGGASADAGSSLASWEISSDAALVLTSVDLPQMSVGLGLAADGKLDEYASRRWTRDGMDVRALVADIAWEARARGYRARMDAGGEALAQVASGNPDPDGEGGRVRGDLLAMSRYLEEMAGAVVAGDSGREAALSKYLQTRCAAVRALLARSW